MTPGISPRSARARKHTRQIWNFRRYPRGRPQIRHRWYRRTENLGSRCCLMIRLVLAITPLVYFRKGNPTCSKSARASSSVRAEVAMQMSMPRVISTLS
jgi:hypothetical protein